ncbi:MAG: hypothetical protein LBF28_03550, partial [Rickettsiales bacterium]|nr:hypothetical protein [Rickettsiales bacterium]
MKNQLESYQSAIEQSLSIRAMARILKLTTMTAWRRLNKVKRTGNLDHGNNHRKPRADKQQVIDLAAKYEDFGISHICELLESRDGVSVNRETFRRWLARPRVRKIQKQRQRREPMGNFGELLQIDGSFHSWFGDKKTCMINIVDDATNTCELHFDEQETIESVCRCAWRWFSAYGVPQAFYADGRNMYHVADKE